MRVLLDGTQCMFSADSIAAAIEQGVEQAHAQGRIVVQVDVDHQPMELEQLQDEAFTAGTADEVSITSLTEAELLLSSLDLGRSAIEVAQDHFNKAAQMIQSGNTSPGMNELSQGIDLWKTVEETVFREAVVQIRDSEIQLELNTHVENLRKALETIQASINAGDLVSLGDSLLYEFPDTSREWSDFLGRCALHLTEDRISEEPEDSRT
ncbi:MAG: hypothetical protein CBC35_04315 [Planctomycetes bacterium TMED75]|nr:hypothetical protein [Planctomycetaceae bacterium]OUU94199.1 MAG: hypothetical protein CBC35_04315 [Planctomycetes bacterium TMED75]